MTDFFSGFAGFLFDLMGILNGTRPHTYEDHRGTYRTPKIRFVFLGLGALFLFLFFPLAIFSLLATEWILCVIIGGFLFYFAWAGINLYSYVVWVRQERKFYKEEFNKAIRERKQVEEMVSVGAAGLGDQNIPDWLAKIWDGRVIDDPEKK